MQEDTKYESESNDTDREVDLILFIKDITTRTSLKDGFQVFANSEELARQDVQEPADNIPRGNPDYEDKIEAYMDGSYIRNGCKNARASAGIWYGPEDLRNMASALPIGLE